MVAGGPREESLRGLLARMRDAMDAGACGIAAGRTVFEAEDQHAVACSLSRLVHAESVALRGSRLLAARS